MSYPPSQPYVSGAPQYQGPPKKSNVGKILLIIAGALVLLCGGGFVACTALVGNAATEVSNRQEAKATHVTIADNGCNVEKADADFLPNVKVDLVIHNTSKNQETYFIDVFLFNSDNERVGNSTAIVNNVRPDQTVKETEYVSLTKKVSGKVTCAVDKVS